MANDVDVFAPLPHPKEVDDHFHVLDRGNILSVVYWLDILNRVLPLDFESFVECGIGRGRSLSILMALNMYLSAQVDLDPRRIIGFDSFQGFPEPVSQDESRRKPSVGDWSESPSGQYKYSPEAIQRVLRGAGLADQLSSLELVPGFFSDTCGKFDTGTIGVLHLDADLYESTRVPLEELSPRLVVGGVIVVDDFMLNDPNEEGESFPGCRIAVNEFLAAHPEFSLHETVRGTPLLVRDEG